MNSAVGRGSRPICFTGFTHQVLNVALPRLRPAGLAGYASEPLSTTFVLKFYRYFWDKFDYTPA